MCKRLFKGLCVGLCLSVLLAALPLSADAATLGDFNDNGRCDTPDAMILYLYTAGQGTLTDAQLAIADINGDGKINMLDTTKLYRVAAGLETLEPSQEDQPSSELLPIRSGVTDESVYMKNIRLYNETTGKTYTAATKEELQTAVAELVLYELGADKFGENSDEAWKAMAIAAYTVLARSCYNGSTYSIWMTSDLDLSRATDRRIYNAVGEVLGVKIAYDDTSLSAYNQLCEILYCASSAGVTCSSLNAWGYVELPYLKSVDSPYDTDEWISYYSLGTDTLTASFQITMSELVRCVSEYMEETIYYDTKAGEYSFYATEADGPYWARTNLYYYRSNGEKRYVSGLDVRNSINIYGKPHVRSHAYTVLSEQNGTLTIQTAGYGHGVGMSGYGMIGYANDAGWNYQQILAHYYSITADTPYGLVGPKW